MVYFLREEEKRYIFRGLLTRARENPADDSWRGWNWNKPPLEPPYEDIYLSVHEISVRECSTMRDSYLRHVEKIRAPPNKRMIRGAVLHETVEKVITQAKIVIYRSGYINGTELSQHLNQYCTEILRKIHEKWTKQTQNTKITEQDLDQIIQKAETLCNYEINQISARIDQTLSKHPYITLDALVNTAIPIIVEQKLDGRFLGLSPNLSADALGFAPVVLDLKTGKFRYWQYLSNTGYALVLEALNEIPIDIGILVNLKFIDNRPIISRKPYLIDDPLRIRFIETRDEIMEIIANHRDPGLPPTCPKDCPYIEICRGEQ